MDLRVAFVNPRDYSRLRDCSSRNARANFIDMREGNPL
jgi:hypothetical protein